MFKHFLPKLKKCGTLVESRSLKLVHLNLCWIETYENYIEHSYPLLVHEGAVYGVNYSVSSCTYLSVYFSA